MAPAGSAGTVAVLIVTPGAAFTSVGCADNAKLTIAVCVVGTLVVADAETVAELAF